LKASRLVAEEGRHLQEAGMEGEGIRVIKREKESSLREVARIVE